MIFRLSSWLVSSITLVVSVAFSAAPEPGAFFEREQPFFHTQIQLVAADPAEGRSENFVVRGILVPLSSTHSVGFDQELLRVAGVWMVPPDQPPITLETMAQISYARPRSKSSTKHPIPTGRLLLTSGMHPGVSSDLEALFVDPRAAARPGDLGRGPLPIEFAHFEGVELAGESAVLRYRSAETSIAEWFEIKTIARETTAGSEAARAPETRFFRHLEIAAHSKPLHFAIGSIEGAPWTLDQNQSAMARIPDGHAVTFDSNGTSVTLAVHRGELVATVAPAAAAERITFALAFSEDAAAQKIAVPLGLAPTPPKPMLEKTRRWSESAHSSAQLGSVAQNGLVLDRIAVPEENPWHRRVRPADLAFLDPDRAAVVTYDGDVWIVRGLTNANPSKFSWERFASGLHEPLAIIAPGGVIQVATKNGVVRLHDRDTNGEADWFENFNDHLVQSQNTRSFPLDMAMAPDGSTFITQGGIVDQSGIKSGGTGTVHSGAILKISPDGRSSSVFATAAREPFLTVHPKTGVVTATDQQGHYIPSSAAYLMREGDSFGFLETNPTKLTPAMAWIPHDQDTSSSSQVWMIGSGMGPWNGRLLHLSYGTGRMFVILPDFAAPIPQAAVIPLGLKTELPLIHARMNPVGDAVFLAGFQIWGTRTTTPWALGRLRVGTTPVTTAIGATSTAEGVILEFAEPVEPASLDAKNVTARAWNYQRSAEYGSGRYTLEGKAGTNAIGVGQVIASTDRKSVFIHMPKLPRVMQLEVRHEFRLASGTAASGVVYFTINQPRPLELAAAGFVGVDLTKSVVVVTQAEEEIATPELGKTLAENLGCVGCHSADGTTDGKVGPTWKHLFGSRRTFVDGSSEMADELYLREKILDPMKKRVTTGPAEMPSYRGVVSESQLEALVFYIRSLRLRVQGETRPDVENARPPSAAPRKS